MFIFIIVCLSLSFGLLVLVKAIRPVGCGLSRFELDRRTKQADIKAKKYLEREALLKDIKSLQQIIVSLLLIVTVLLAVKAFGWLIGILVALVVSFSFATLAKLKIIRQISQKLYDKFDDRLVLLIKKFPLFFKLINNVLPGDIASDLTINSRQDLQHLVAESSGVLSDNEKTLISSSLEFSSRLVQSVMTPRSMIDYIRKNEFLGPLTLDDLHKKGHSRLPVISSDIDHIVGILNIRNLLTLDIKKSTTAEKAMDSKVYYIRQDQTLEEALAAFLRTKHHLFIVINEFRETVGLLALEDTIEALIGRKINDEFDTHDDLRLVAMRNPNGNNQPEKSENV